MSKITTIIDIGSNSMRMVVLEKSSRFAFSLINETKSRVKISEGCYENGGNLQEIPMQRAYEALKSFLNISKALNSRKILCVATSALRDAPNSKVFLSRVKKDLGLNIKVIDGEKEAYYGGVATSNLLHDDEFVTVDIGGGSTEFCFVQNKKIVKTISLDVGTVRLRELYFNKNDVKGAEKYILESLKKVLNSGIKIPQKVVGIGGSIRFLSKLIMQRNEYPLDMIHAFTYNAKNEKKLFSDILNTNSNEELEALGVKKDRFDTIKEGTFIFKTIIDALNVSQVVTSGVGVREGVYLTDLLRNQNHRFPNNFNISVKSLLDRFELNQKQSTYLGKNARAIFEVLKPLHKLDDSFIPLLVVASKLHSIGTKLNFYKSNDNAFDFILNGLNYDFQHTSRVTVAYILKFSKKSLPKEVDILKYKELLPSLEKLQWLSFMQALNLGINIDFSSPKVKYELVERKLKLDLENSSFMVNSHIEKLELPNGIEIEIL
ncbi:Ppx/GppA phosphatase family protein [Arcobacter porcinus]|uniref:Guanosine-5'-triphosphate,3'-diphosphate pyrophosphatase n=1 Tax=Arcobacter porcinus TaxID=1935204 RepID=A0ABX2YA02_9BACT|nr:Ppx/GppA phosphatase family protein [Arcobacter porcinus]OCL89943.1 Guanosine-5'-triphosphate,3'-diphosphate pyrophosphatase [Arcobacter porcinus]